jgi:Skp family chaperone for outer membrane proteins
MKMYMKIISVSVLALAMLAFTIPGPAAAQSKGKKAARSKAVPAKVAILDIERIKRKSLAGKSIRKQVDVKRKALLKEAGREQKKLRAAENELRMQRSLLSPEALRDREKKFKDRIIRFQRAINARKKNLEKSLFAAQRVLDKNLKVVLERIVKEMKIDLILGAREVLYVRQSFDITIITMKRLDARLKKVTLRKPKK